MNILHIDTERTWRGGQQQVLSLIEGLSKRGHNNVAVVQVGGALRERLRGKCEVMEVNHFAEWDFISAHFVNRKIKREKIDVIHAHSGHAVALAALSRLGTKIPFVLTRRVDFPVGRNMFSRWKYGKAAAVAAISNKVREVLLQSGIPSEKIHLIPSGVDFKRFLDVRPISKELFGFPGGRPIVGQVAALAPHKDQAGFLQAVSILKKKNIAVGAVLVGDGPLRAELEEKTRQLGLTEDVKFVGYQERPLDYLAAFDIFCLSSYQEGLGTSLIDAMALKIPVVATTAGGIPDLVEDNRTGFTCPPNNPVALADTIIRSFKAHNKMQIVAEAAKKAQNFDVLRTIEGTETLYKEVLQLYPQTFPHN